MTVKEIVKDYLERNGYDGLCGDNCGCSKEDFPACERLSIECRPAYKKKANCLSCPIQCDAYDENEEVECYTTEKPDKTIKRLPFIVQALIVIVPTILLWLLLFGLSLLINHDRWYVNAGITLVMVLIAGVAVLGMTKDDERDFSDVP